ncbi:MAG TPA: hypothetical protein VFO79_15820 [Xanthomonadales bacterium]|nr:hypothetical protein [Xanthomonadales bacterium]
MSRMPGRLVGRGLPPTRASHVAASSRTLSGASPLLQTIVASLLLVSPVVAAEIDIAALLDRLDRFEKRLEQGEAGNARLDEPIEVGAGPGQRVDTTTPGVNWHRDPNPMFLLNYARFDGVRTPLDPVGDRAEGDAAGPRLHSGW